MVTTIVAEYDPFHKGHLYHIKKTKEINKGTYIAAIMSGNFVQRGEPAVFDKFKRTKMALENGVDIVLELPVEYACSSADVFARGAMETAVKSGITDCISFGSESGNVETIKNTARILAHEPEKISVGIKNYMQQGLSYPAARSKAICEVLHTNSRILKEPNDILATEYEAALIRMGTDIPLCAVRRQQAQHNSTLLSEKISSAKAIRNCYETERKKALSAVPENCLGFYEGIEKFPCIDDYTSVIKYILSVTPKEKLQHIADISEGLENRILSYINEDTVSNMIKKVKTKRYTYTRIQRAFLHILLNIEKKEQQLPVRYIRVLGIKKEQKHLLNLLSEKAEVPVIVNVKENEELLQKEILATDIYNILHNTPKGMEYINSPVIV